MGYFFECLIHKYFDFSGRARRKEYWWYTIICTLISVVILIFAANQRNAMFVEAVKRQQSLSSIPAISPFDVVLYIWCIFTLCPSLAVLTRRLHDINKGAGTLLVYIIHNTLLQGIFYIPQSIVGKDIYNSFPLIFICLVGIGIFLLALLCRKGTDGQNDYGLDPLEKCTVPEDRDL